MGPSHNKELRQSSACENKVEVVPGPVTEETDAVPSIKLCPVVTSYQPMLSKQGEVVGIPPHEDVTHLVIQ